MSRHHQLHTQPIEDGLILRISDETGRSMEVELTGQGARLSLLDLYASLENPREAAFPLESQTPAIFLSDPDLQIVPAKRDDGTESVDFVIKHKHLPPFRFSFTRDRIAQGLLGLIEIMKSPPKAN